MQIHVISNSPAAFGIFTACGINADANRRIVTRPAGTAAGLLSCKRCKAVITGSYPDVPCVKDCIAYVESCGWKFSHKSIIGTYVFYNEQLAGQFNHELAFTLRELRDAKRYGF